jgi:uncharacterized protein YggE
MHRTNTLTLAAAFAASGLLAAPAHAEEPAPRIQVVGEGIVAAAPDMAILSMTVAREAATARQAVSEQNTAMTEVLAAMKDAGIAERDLQTSGFSIEPVIVYPNQPNEDNKPKVTGYFARNTLTVRIRDLATTGAVLDNAVTLGVNQAGGLSFSNADPAAFIVEARTRAVKDALARAATLAQAAGVEVGPILDISEQNGTPDVMPIAMRRMAAEMASDAVPVAAGENEYRITVNVTFAIKQ